MRPSDRSGDATLMDDVRGHRALIGVGFGPSNIALAIALEERLGRFQLQTHVRFVERQSRSLWHGGMLLPHTSLQVAFLKDLVALRNPTSRYTFVNFLHQAGRLEEFVNLRTFFPYRLDFAQYIEWVADQFRSITHYGEAVVEVAPVGLDDHGRITQLRVRLASGKALETPRLVVATGGTPKIPAVFHGFVGPRVFHSSEFLDRMASVTSLEGKTVVVIGAGQSGAEIMHHLLNQFAGATVVGILRDLTFRSSDDSHFINEVFFNRHVDSTYAMPADRRAAFLASLRATNYAVVDPELIESLYRLMYEARLRGRQPLELLGHTVVTGVRSSGSRIELACCCQATDTSRTVTADYVVLATGYYRLPLPDYLGPIAGFLVTDENGQPRLGRDFRAQCAEDFLPPVYLLGFAEHSHGIADTLLSLTAQRAGAVCESLLATWPEATSTVHAARC